LSVRAIGDLERGKSRRPYPDSIRRLADALQLSGGARNDLFTAAGLLADAARPALPEAVGAPPAIPSVEPRQLPAPVRHFVGRARELADLSERVRGQVPGTVVILAIGGMAGIGKTALALQFAHEVIESFPDGQLHVNLRGFDPALPPMSADEAVRLALDAFAVPTDQIPASLDAQIRLYRSLLAGKRVLILLDNAADADQVRPLLPGSPSCLVVVTSRNLLAGMAALDGSMPLSLDVLSPAEAHQLFAVMLGSARVSSEGGAALEVIEACGYLPLALAITAARAATQPQLSMAALAAELAAAGRRLDALDSMDDILASVRAALDTSHQHLDAGTARTLRLMGVHPGPSISASAAASLVGIPFPVVQRHLNKLTDASLASRDAASRYVLHDLVRLYAAEQAQRNDNEPVRKAAIRRMLDHYLHTGHSAACLLRPTRDPIALGTLSQGAVPESIADYQEALDWFDAEHQVLLAAIDAAVAEGLDTYAWDIAWTLSHYLYYRGHWHDQQAVSQAALEAALRLGDLVRQGKSHYYLACCYIARDPAEHLARYDDAQTHHLHALALFQQVGDRTWQAHVHVGLARTFLRMKDHRAALDQGHHALELYAAANDLGGLAGTLNTIGWIHIQLGEYSLALEHCGGALELSRKLGDRMAEALTLDSIGYARHHLGSYGDAIACYQQAAEILHDLSHQRTQTEVLERLGDAFLAGQNSTAAFTTWRRALAILDDPGNPATERMRAKIVTAEGCVGESPGKVSRA
jgi:tetratricopeptide (TPR) repeat protein